MLSPRPQPGTGGLGGLARLVLLLALAGSARTDAPASQEFAGFLNPGESPLVFATFGDCGDVLSNTRVAKVASMVKGWRPDFIVGLGDLNYGSTLPGSPDWDIRIGSRYGDYILGRADGRYPLQTSLVQKYFPVVGNHDTSVGGLGGGDVRGYVDYFVRDADGLPDRLPSGGGVHGDEVSFYDFVVGDAHIVVADSDRGRVSPGFAEAQNAWIGDVLGRSTARWKFLVMHHPAYSSDGVHGSQTWMRGAHLHLADAVFAGHAHVYERLEVSGTPFFTVGTGGRPPYFFADDPHPGSRARASVAPAVHGAVRVSVAGDGVLIEYVSIGDEAGGTAGGRVLDSLVLGDFEPVANVGEHQIEAVAGQALVVSTSTPDAGGARPVLDPRIEIVNPAGEIVAEAAGGAGDGLNASLEFTVSEPGRYRVRVRPEGGTRGDYLLSVTADPEMPPMPLEVWRVQQFGEGAGEPQAESSSDWDGDGLDNLTEYALGTSATDPGDPAGDDGRMRLIHAPSVSVAELTLREGIRDDLVYAIETTSSFSDDAWMRAAERAPGNSWEGDVQVVEAPGAGDAVVLRIADDRQRNLARNRFYRLAVRRVP